MSSNNNLSPEENVLLLLMEFSPAPDKRDLLLDLISRVSVWDKISKVAITSGLAPLFYKNIQALNLKSLFPEPVVQKFKNQYIQTLFKNTFRTKAFELIVKELNDKKVDFIPLKGIYLISTLYQDMGLRNMCDVDFLVRPDDVERCKDILLEQGWSIRQIHKTDAIKSLNIAATPYVFVKGDLTLEMHQKLYETGTSFDMPNDVIWANAKPFSFLGGTAHQLNFHDLLLHQILHLYKHLIAGQSILKSFVDIVTLYNHGSERFDIQQFSKMAVSYRCEKELSAINDVFKTYFSLDFGIDSHHSKINCDLNMLFKYMLNNDKEAIRTYLEKHPISYITNDSRLDALASFSQKIIFIVGNLFPSRSFMLRRYQIRPYQLLFYYPYRILSLLVPKQKR